MVKGTTVSETRVNEKSKNLKKYEQITVDQRRNNDSSNNLIIDNNKYFSVSWLIYT